MKTFSSISFQDQHVLITGASGGLGQGLALKFLLHGAKVTLHYKTNIQPLDRLLKDFPTKTFPIKADATEELSVIALYEKAIEKFGVVNILIANHAFLDNDPIEIEEMSLQRWKKSIDVNVTGVFLFIREYLKHMKSHLSALKESDFLNFKEFSIIIIGSVSGKIGKPFFSEYSTSKSALMFGLTKTLKNEIVKIHPKARINVVSPAWILTPMSQDHIKQGFHFSSFQTMPLKKLSTTEDISNSVLFLCNSDLSGHTTGIIIDVDGGMEGRAINNLEDLLLKKPKL